MHAQTEFDLSAGFAKSDALLAKRAAANVRHTLVTPLTCR